MVEQLAKVLLNYLSDIVSAVLPDEPTPEQLSMLTNSTVTAYAVAKTFGADIVESTENEIDDKILDELLESCEEAAVEYGFSLNAEDY